MMRHSRFLWGSFFSLVVAILFVLIMGGNKILHRGIPRYNDTASLKGLSKTVHVVRDEHGVPHIFADNMNDAARALGYVHASERFFQMEMQRRAGQGRLSEVIGPDTLDIDKFTRTLGLYHLAETSFESLSPEAKKYFEAYADGVNTWLTTHDNAMPEEFFVLRIKPEPWRPADSMVWGKLMALTLSHNYELEVMRSELKTKISPAMLADIFPVYPALSPVTVAPHSAILPSAVKPEPLTKGKKKGSQKLPGQKSPEEKVPDQKPADEKSGQLLLDNPMDTATTSLGNFIGLDHAASNEWVIAGSRTNTGKPILANDPHLGLEVPVLWYLARIVTPQFWIKGATVPGLPIVLLGQNDHIAWGFTTTNSDTEELFIETTDPKDAKRYLTPTGSAPFTTRQEIIHVKGAADTVLDVRTTRHGPVLSDINPTMARLAGTGKVIALAFTALDGNDRTPEALMRLNQARNWQEFQSALKLYEAPTQNVVYADRNGHIGFINPGLVPIRKKGDGSLPADGATGEYDWQGMVPFASLPTLFDPDAGLIFNANNIVISGDQSPYFYSSDWDEPYRARRLQNFFDSITTHTLGTSAIMQSDHLSTAALELLPYLTELKPNNPRTKEALTLLKKWDGTMDKDKAEPLIFEAWLYELHKKILVDKTKLTLDADGPYIATALAAILIDDDKDWCGPLGCHAITLAALEDALSFLSERYGSNLSSWRWGQAHITVLKHKVFSHVPLLSRLTDLSVPSSGGYYTLDRGEGADVDGEQPFLRRLGPGYRGLYDLADPEASRFMIATGESGHIFSPHYGDLLKLWNNGESFTLTGSYNDLQARALPELTLQP